MCSPVVLDKIAPENRPRVMSHPDYRIRYHGGYLDRLMTVTPYAGGYNHVFLSVFQPSLLLSSLVDKPCVTVVFPPPPP